MDLKKQERFKSLYGPLHKPLDGFCRMIAGNKMDAEDLLHDTVLITIRYFEKIKSKEAMLSYMFTVASNLCKKQAFKRKRMVEWDQEEVGSIMDKSMNPELMTDFRIIHEKILDLPQKTGETLILYYISDLKLEDIQKIQGGSLSGVKLRLKRGKEKLLSMLNEKERVIIYMFFL